jgi:hypothetical protein
VDAFVLGAFDTLNWQFIIDVSECAMIPSSKSDTVFFYVFGALVVEELRYKLEVAGSIPDGVLPAALWQSTQPLTEMNTRGISWAKACQYVGLITLPPSCAVSYPLILACVGGTLQIRSPFLCTDRVDYVT